MNHILLYLTREYCSAGCFMDGGILNHCTNCQLLFDNALKQALELSKLPTYQQKKQLENERILEIAAMKKSHVWVGVQNYSDATKTRMMPVASHCRKCGLSMPSFKTNPAKCPKSE